MMDLGKTDTVVMREIVQKIDKAFVAKRGIRLTQNQTAVLQDCLVEMTCNLMTLEMAVVMEQRKFKEKLELLKKSVVDEPLIVAP
jgi:hypothetical protein